MPRTPTQPPIAYRDRQSRVWYVSEVARLKVVSASIDGPNVALVIRFEREGEERFARRVGGDEWRKRSSLHRLFAEAEPVEADESRLSRFPKHLTTTRGVGLAPRETGALWVELVATTVPDELADFEERTFLHWDRPRLVAMRRAIDLPP